MKIINEIVNKVSSNKGELGIIFGGICVGAAVVSASIATLKLEKIVDEHHDAIDAVKDEHIVVDKTSDDGTAITTTISDTKAYRKALTKIYFSTGVKMCRLYAPTGGLLAISAIFIGGSYRNIKDLKKENVRLFTALRGSEAVVKRYREEMAERVGEEEERRFYNNITKKDIEYLDIDENGKERKHKIKGAEVVNDELSGDAFIFDESCAAYVGHDINHNLYIAGLLKNQCSDNLYSNRSLMMFEILDAFGVDRDEVAGSFYRGYLSKGPNRDDNQIDMDIRTVWVYDELKGEYVEKILIDPKLDGVIVDKL